MNIDYGAGYFPSSPWSRRFARSIGTTLAGKVGVSPISCTSSVSFMKWSLPRLSRQINVINQSKRFEDILPEKRFAGATAALAALLKASHLLCSCYSPIAVFNSAQTSSFYDLLFNIIGTFSFTAREILRSFHCKETPGAAAQARPHPASTQGSCRPWFLRAKTSCAFEHSDFGANTHTNERKFRWETAGVTKKCSVGNCEG